MGTVLIQNAAHIETFDDGNVSVKDGSIFIRDNAIESIGPAASQPQTADRIVDARGCVVIPGLVNTHHHFYQTLTRAVPGAQDVELFDWLTTLYEIWAELTPASLRTSTQVAAAELLLSGCTTAMDHCYMWPNGCTVDEEVAAAREIGLRFHASRGSMSVGRSNGGLPPDSCVEDEAFIMSDTRRAIEQLHDKSRFAMTRIVNAPCSPFSVSENLMRESVAMARGLGVHSHTHLAETIDEEKYCLEKFGRRPLELAESLGWMGEDVWHAHVVHPNAAEVGMLGRTRTGVAHCPSSNMRLGSGIAPIVALAGAGARVGIGCDGSASNDGSSLLDEVRHAMLLQRVGYGAKAITARDVLRLGTRGGAAVLGRDDIGYLAPGMAADLAGYRLDTISMAGGAVHDPVGALVFCRPVNADFTVVNGKPLVEHGAFTELDVDRLIAQHNDLARAMVSG